MSAEYVAHLRLCLSKLRRGLAGDDLASVWYWVHVLEDLCAEIEEVQVR